MSGTHVTHVERRNGRDVVVCDTCLAEFEERKRVPPPEAQPKKARRQR